MSCWIRRYLLWSFALFFSSLAAADASLIPQLSVSGQSHLKRPADQAILRLGVTTEASTAAEALKENSEQMRNLIAALEDAGLKEKEFETGQFSLQALYTQRSINSPEDWVPKIRGYQVDNKLMITTQKINQLGDWIDIAVKKGANAIDELSFGLHDTRIYRNEAIQDAVHHAQADAKALATSAGIRLGRLLVINLDQAFHQPVVRTMELRAFNKGYAAQASPPISGGDVDVQAQVTLVYEILQ